ncbi:MAG TPA: DUF4296 domain-containing protein [Bacteroidales bacterium]|nr:DUF4296 domain-containing protein [Bacteroidales bacterium]
MRPIIFLSLLCFLASCGGPKKELLRGKLSADSVIPRNEMINVLVDVHLVEASLNLQRNREGNVPLLTQNYYQWLCRKHHISPQRFRDNLNYYKMDPENFSKMYEEVVKNLTDKANKPGEPGKK